jgi:DNA integrity scanning protein DisA with diadenylate cyclase activity
MARALEASGVSAASPRQQLVRAAIRIARDDQVERLIYVSDRPPPDEGDFARVQSKLVQVVTDPERRDALDSAGRMAVAVPGFDIERQDKVKLALVGAAARGYVHPGDHVVALVGRRPAEPPDTLLVLEIEAGSAETTQLGGIGASRVAPSVFESIVELAVEIGIEGWEGHALGALFVVGDVERVLVASRQLSLNPFQGYPEAARNLVDPAVREAVRGFATLDGAFVVREDGVVEAAGRYLQLEPRPDVTVPLGVGARHMAAALVTAATDAIAIVVSQTSGRVRVFRKGAVVLEITPSHRRT